MSSEELLHAAGSLVNESEGSDSNVPLLSQHRSQDEKLMKDEEGETSRLELLSDAVFSIIATIGILPVMESLKEEDLPEFGDIVYYIYVYFTVFTLVAVKYRMHCSEFRRASEINGPIIALNFLYMGLLALYPFIVSLLIAFPSSTNPAVLAALLFLSTETVYMTLLAAINYGTKLDRRTGTLFARVTRETSSFKNVLAAAAAFWLFSASLATLMLVLAFVSPGAAFSVFIFVPISNRLLFRLLFIWNRAASKRFEASNARRGEDVDPDAEKLQWSRRRQKRINFGVERSSAFTDGIFAISITLVAVNIRAPEGAIDEEDTLEAMQQMMPQFASYAVAFGLLTYLWYWNNLSMSCVKSVAVIAFWSNMICMLCVGVVPAAVEVVFAYDFSSFSAGLVCAVTVAYSVFQTVFLLQILSKEKDLAEGVFMSNAKKAMLLSVPIIQLIGGSLGLALSFIPGTAGVVLGLFCPSASVLLIIVTFLVLDPRLKREEGPGLWFRS